MVVAVDVKNLAEVPAFTTKDGSEIRELLAHRNSVIANQSLAEARLPAGASTMPHYHPLAEEIYFLTAGAGRMQIEEELRDVGPGDAIAIPPGARHQTVGWVERATTNWWVAHAACVAGKSVVDARTTWLA